MAVKITKRVAITGLGLLAIFGFAAAAFAYVGTIHYGRVTVYNVEPSDVGGQPPVASYNVTSSTALSAPALARNGWACNADWTRPSGINMSCRHRSGTRRQMRVNCPAGNRSTRISGSLGLYADGSQMTVKGLCVEKQIHVMD